MAEKKRFDRPVAPPDASADARNPIDTAIDSFFENDAQLRTALSRNLKERGRDARAKSQHAKAALKNFAPSRYSEGERAKRNYVPAGEDPGPKTRSVVDKGVASMRDTAPRRRLKIDLASALGQQIEKRTKGGKESAIGLAELIGYMDTKVSGGLAAPSGPSFTQCRAEAEAEERLNTILGVEPAAATDAGTGAGAGTGTTIAGAAGTPGDPLTWEALVADQVRAQMASIASPEERVRYAVPGRSDPSEVGRALDTFELRAGPADVTSYHDFNTLQIAFEHVWTEIFDGRLAALGQELFHEYVKLQDFAGGDTGDRSIDTIDDLKQLMAEIRELGQIAATVTPTSLQPSGDGKGAPPPAPTAGEIVDVALAVLDPASGVANAIGDKTVAAIVDPVGTAIHAIAGLIAGTPLLKWTSFPGPLPGEGDLISFRIEPGVAAPGTVEIVLEAESSGTRGWKGMHFQEFDASNRPSSSFWISTDRNDSGVWSRASYNTLPLYTSQINLALLEFWKEGIFGIHTKYYVMGDLNEKVKDRSRITFTWLKD